MKKNQTEIYYLLGENLDHLRRSPQLEAYRARAIEVLLLTDPVDSFWVTIGPDHDGKPMRSITQGEVDLSSIPLQDENTPKPDDAATISGDEIKALCDAMASVLGEAVSEVRRSKRLVESPACIIAANMAPDRALERLLARQDQDLGLNLAPVLEINPDHALIKAMLALEPTAKQNPEEGGEAGEGGASDEFADLAWLLLDQARIMEGDAPGDPARFTERLNRWIARGL